MTLSKIIEICNEKAELFNYDIDFPITLNSRLTSTLGRVKRYPGSKYTLSMEFSKNFVETSSDDLVKEVVIHELAHAIVNSLYPDERVGHGPRFKDMYFALGGTGAAKGAKTMIEENVEEVDRIYKYTCYCSKCKKFIGGYKRAGKVIKNIDSCTSKCCGAAINMFQNW